MTLYIYMYIYVYTLINFVSEKIEKILGKVDFLY